jgi:uncharacterized alpha-E superfamily protein
LNRLYLHLQSPSARAAFRESPIGFYRSLVDHFHSFQGITDATMTHGEGWHFLQAGKYLERADATSRVLDFKYHVLLPSGERVGGNVDVTQWMAVLRSCSAMEAYLKLFHGRVTSWEVAGFLILHASFPRSIRFSVDALDQALHSISGSERGHFSNEAERLSGMLRSTLDYTTVDSIFQSGLHQYLDQTQTRIDEVSRALAETYCSWL